jgi:predicted RNA-binding protein YlxR (DUF448 family)/ribosomal protein L30E
MALAEQHEDPDGRSGSMGGSRERRCIVTGEVLPEARLLRFVLSPDGQVVPDVEAKLPGRGLWVSADRTIIAQAVAKRLFARAAKAPASADGGLPERAESRLVERILAHLGLARRAGELVLGFDSVDKALRGANPPVLIVEASEAAPDGRRKLQAAARAGGHVPFVIGALTNAELSLALGRENVVHAALNPGRIAERLIFEAARLSGFRPLRPWVWEGFSDGKAGGPG